VIPFTRSNFAPFCFTFHCHKPVRREKFAYANASAYAFLYDQHTNNPL